MTFTGRNVFGCSWEKLEHRIVYTTQEFIFPPNKKSEAKWSRLLWLLRISKECTIFPPCTVIIFSLWPFVSSLQCGCDCAWQYIAESIQGKGEGWTLLSRFYFFMWRRLVSWKFRLLLWPLFVAVESENASSFLPSLVEVSKEKGG